MAVIACGALAAQVREIAGRRGWPVEVHPLPALLHNRPAQIAPAARELTLELQASGRRVALAYADCGSYGALDRVCADLGIDRLAGLHCYDVLAGADRIAAMLEAEPGTYLLTDFLVRSFRRTVLAELGLDRYPELWPDYFGNYRRLVWLAQARDAALDEAAAGIAGLFGLPLTVIDTGTTGLERELQRLLTAPAPDEQTTPHAARAACADRAARADRGARADRPALAARADRPDHPARGACAGHQPAAPAQTAQPAQTMIVKDKGPYMTQILRDHEGTGPG